MRRRQGYIDKGYTDFLAFVGLNQREAEQDVEDWMRRAPELFLGYNVRVFSVEQFHRFHGLRISAYIMTDRARCHRSGPLAEVMLWRSIYTTRPPRTNGAQ